MPPRISTTELHLLLLLQEEATYGLALWIRLQPHAPASRSSTYEALNRLRRLGYITRVAQSSAIGPTRWVWHLTTRGRSYAETALPSLHLLLRNRLNRLLQDYRRFTRDFGAFGQVGEETVPYPVRGNDVEREVGGHPAAQTTDVRVDSIGLRKISQAPAMLPDFYARKDTTRYGGQEGEKAELTGSEVEEGTIPPGAV